MRGMTNRVAKTNISSSVIPSIEGTVLPLAVCRIRELVFMLENHLIRYGISLIYVSSLSLTSIPLCCTHNFAAGLSSRFRLSVYSRLSRPGDTGCLPLATSPLWTQVKEDTRNPISCSSVARPSALLSRPDKRLIVRCTTHVTPAYGPRCSGTPRSRIKDFMSATSFPGVSSETEQYCDIVSSSMYSLCGQGNHLLLLIIGFG